jgi:eukaryotic-like serine/threonine-protein kinase
MRECPSCFSCFDDTVNLCPGDECSTFNSLPGGVALEGKYVLERRLGEGGMGVVYKAHHKFLKTTRAIKTIKRELIGNDPSFVKRFHQEAMAAAAIGHPNIIAVLDYGLLQEKIPYIVMEFVEGVSLETLILNKTRFTPEEALEYMQVITSALSAAHKHGIVHRDLKPLNIMIESGGTVREQIRILDFGLAKIKASDLFGSFVAAKTVGIVGSPAYMAPEQWSEEETDRRCDVYSLGIILFEMLTGDVPFKGSNIPSIMKKHLMAPPPPLATPGSGISTEVEQVVHRALEKQREMRTASVEEFIAEFEQAVLHPSPVRAKPKKRSTAKATTRTRRRKTSQLTVEESGASVDDEAKVSEEAVVPVFAQDVDTVRSPEARGQSENETAKLPRPLTSLASNKPESLPKASAPVPRKAEKSTPSEGVENRDKPDRKSKPIVPPIVPPVTNQRLPGRVAISQQSFVGNFLRRRFAVPLVAGVVVLCLIGLSLFVYSMKEAAPPGLQAQSFPLAVNMKREMVLIEGGTFTMGWNNNKGEEQKGEHTVTVASFYLDKYEVTNAEYAEFIKDTGKPAPAIAPGVKGSYWEPWNGKNPPSGRERWPVANVSPNDAEAFAAWLSRRDGVVYRLPTEEEWEFAARNGSKDSLFPWGNSWEDGRANINGKTSPVDVGSFPRGATVNGVQDMVGNVWEWTSSKARFYDNGPVLSHKNGRVRRGGSFFEKFDSDFYNATDRSWFGDENFKFPTVGFRLARDRE